MLLPIVACETNQTKQGLLAKVKFHVSYRNKALIKPLQQVKLSDISVCVYKS